MALPFLNNINLSDNQLQNAKLHITGTAPTAAAAQIYFDSSDTIAKYYSNATDTWISLVQTDFANGTFVSLTNGGTSIKRAYTVDLSAVDGTSTAASRFLTKDNEWATIPFGDVTEVQGGTYINVTDQTGPVPIVNHDLTTRSNTTSTASPAYGATFTVIDTITTNTTGHITDVNTKTVTIPASDNTNTTYGLDKAAGSANLILAADGTNQDSIEFAGTANEIEIDVATEDVYTFGFPTAGVVLPDGSTATTQTTGDNSTKVATTAFVQASVTGLLEFKGGFNANTGILDDGSGGDLYTDVVIAVGDYYVVTTAGDFFGNAATPLTVGDSVIAQSAVPDPGTTAPVEGDFIVVQSDTDLATATTVGLGNVVPGSSATITAPYLAGTSTLDVVDSSSTQKGAVIVAGGTGISVAYSTGTATVTNTETNANNTFSGTIGDGSLTSLPVTSATHGLGTDSSSFMIQLVEVSSGETVYADVTRGASGLVTIDFAAAPATNAIRVLIQKIG